MIARHLAWHVALMMAALAGAVLFAQFSPARPARTLQDGVYTALQATRGQAIYEAHCAECHMHDLAGHDYAGPLAGFGFQLKWQDSSLGELLARIRSMPLGSPGSLTGQESVDILAYVLERNGFPAGATELTAAAAAQWPPIRIERLLRTEGSTHRLARPEVDNADTRAAVRAMIAASGITRRWTAPRRTVRRDAKTMECL